jgi:PAS domain S-box-containing protein
MSQGEAATVPVLPDEMLLESIRGAVCVHSDICEKLRAMTQRCSDVERILEGLPDTYYRTDAAGKVLYCTQTAKDIFGVSPEDMIGRPLADFYVTPEERAEVVQRILAAKGQYVLVEARVKRANGGISWASTRARALFDKDGKFAGVEGCGRDISQRVYMEQALRDSLNQLESKEQAKTRFLAAASHDLRQPIQAINLFLDGLRNSNLDARQQKIAGQLGTAVDSLSDLLDTFLDVSRLDAGVVEPHPHVIQVHELLEDLENSFAGEALRRGLRFRLWLPLGTLAIYSDKGMMNSILRNLVANALSYTPYGGVLVSARRRRNEVLFQVWDTGIGIADEHKDMLFEEFYQASNPERDRNKGLGLGLAIVRRMASLLGMPITLRSEVGRGSVFELRLPLYDPAIHGPDKIAITPMGSAERASFQGKRFLVVEDDDQLARSLEVWVDSLNAAMIRYPSAETALSMADLNAVDFFIVDYRLPGDLNGIDFLHEAKHRRSTPVRGVVITGDTSPEFIAQAKGSGWPLLFKPITPNRLLAALLSSA